jgi:hypothetical protein
LRLNVVPPPRTLTAAYNVHSQVNLSWDASAEPGVSYQIYRGSNMANAFTNRLNSAPIGGNSYTDQSPSPTQKIYQVRAVKLTTTASGTYTNNSQGSFATLPN